MKARTVNVLAWGSLAIAATLSTLAVLITSRNGPVVVPPDSGTSLGASLGTEVGFGLGLLSFSVVGALIATRRPDNGIGWLFCGTGLLLAFTNFAGAYEAHGISTNPGSLPGATWLALSSDVLWVPFIAMTTVFLFLLFPEGRPVGRGRTIASRLALFGIGAAILGGVLEQHLYGFKRIPNPIGIRVPSAVGDVLSGLGFFLILGVLLYSVWSLIHRLRRARGDERLQLRWFVYAAGLVMVIFVPTTLIDTAPVPLQVLGGLALLGLPVSVAIAILKYRLYDIEVVINKTVVYSALAAFITLVYVAIVVGLGTVIRAGNGNLGLSIAATAIVAVAFQPVHQRVQRFANRVVHGGRASPYEILARFSERVAETYATEDVVPRTARVIAEGTGAERARVWLRVGDELRPAAAWPESDANEGPVHLVDGDLPAFEQFDRAVAVRYQGDLLGALTVSKPRGEPLTPTETKLLDDLAEQAGLVLSNVRLTTELEAKLDQISAQAAELRASRQRIVSAQDEERRRLERNIHDGAQQHLVALAVKLRLARGLVARDPARARPLLRELRAQLDEALDTLTALSLGIYPPLLEEQGIAAALAAQYLQTGMPVRMETNGTRRYPIETEAAVYFCVLEALQNTAKHARASEVVVRLDEQDGALVFEVADDGRGFDPARTGYGTGLQGMADRLAALDGTLEVRSAPDEGTTIAGRLPVRSIPEAAS